MKKYKKIMMAFICIFMVMFVALPTIVNAEEPPEIKKLIAILWGPDVYYEEENGKIYDNTEKFGLKYNKETNTLTLNNYKGEAIYYSNMGDDFKIELLGENIVYPAVDADSTFACISGHTNVEFIGDGKLTLDPTIVSTGTNDFTKYPLEREILIAEGDMVINGPEITIKSELPAISAENLKIKKGKLITNSLKLTGNLVISGGEVVVENGIGAKTINITGGKTIVNTSGKDGLGMYTYKGEISITGGTLDVKTEEFGVALYSAGKIILGDNMKITNNYVIENTKVENEEVGTIVDEKGMMVPNVEIIEYNFTEETKNQEIDLSKEKSLTFVINIEYEYFKNGGKLFIDGKEISSKYYTSKSGSTIISLTEEYVKTIAAGKHEISVQFGNGIKVKTNFTVINNVSEEKEPVINEEGVGNKEETPEKLPEVSDKVPDVKPEIKDESEDIDKKPVVKDETPNTGRQEVNVQAIIAVIMLGVVGLVVVSEKRA